MSEISEQRALSVISKVEVEAACSSETMITTTGLHDTIIQKTTI
jgi:hypothetical protein